VETRQSNRHVTQYEETLRRLAVRDDRYIEAVLGDEVENLEMSGLQPKAYALVRLAALIALDAPSASYQFAVDEALDAGATLEEMVGTLIAVIPVTGVPRVVGAAPKLGLALGYDVDAALERLENGRETAG
jgi:4-carboxymuconolactone decarboxylase